MSNLPATIKYHNDLPAFLQSPDLFAETDKTIAGIGGGIPPYISIKASKWRLVGADGEEAMVNQLHLEVIVLGGNEHVSKTYYAGAYDPAGGNTSPPTCFSDNGVAPSSTAMTPQSVLCANCPHNAWGSKVSEVTGKDLKACGDSKKLAVVLAADTPIVMVQGNVASTAKALEQVYLLRVPAASMRVWRDYAKGIRGHGAPIIGLVTVLGFDATVSYPSILFKASKFVDEATFRTSQKLLEGTAVAEAVGANDTPRAAPAALPGPVPAHLAAPVEANPLAAAPAPQQAPPPVAAAAAPPPQAAPVAPTPRRPGRPPAQPPAAAPVAAAPAPSLFAALAGNGAVIQQPTASSPDLDALLASALA